MNNLEMQGQNQQSSTSERITVQGSDRCQMYHRLQTLDISCQCKTNQPLQVKLDSILTTIQIWSVAKQYTASRQELVDWLEGCWLLEQ